MSKTDQPDIVRELEATAVTYQTDPGVSLVCRTAADEIVAARDRAEKAEVALKAARWGIRVALELREQDNTRTSYVRELQAKLAKAREGLEWYASSDRSDSRSCYVARATLKDIT